MLNLEDLSDGQRLEGVIPGEIVSVIAVQPQGADVVKLIYETANGDFSPRIFTREEIAKLSVAHEHGRPFDAPATDFRLVAECQRIKLAGLWDPMLAVTTSDIQPLPHQLRAVYGELLPRRPLRFLLADDPGAGKTIMAGLYVKELILREDVKRCLIVAPGGLVDQWRDELFFKFGLRFEIFTTQLADAPFGGSVFDQHPLIIARMDQLSRNDLLIAELEKAEWDLVVVDEAHRMSAHYFGNELKKSKRFALGEVLRDRARHLLLMTATPHSGSQEDFEVFLSLLDEDIFEGRYDDNLHQIDTTDLMRRMIKEDLLTFEGKKLFPERIAETVNYQLSPLEQDLYEQVTTYVKQGMNRADKLDPKRRNTVGFALTVLQRRLASSPEAILRSLERRTERLERRKQELASGKAVATTGPADLPEIDEDFDDEEYSADELEQVEDQLVDAATAARTIQELDVELAELRDLTGLARRVRGQDKDRKWSELRTILENETLVRDDTPGGARRKLIIFTEHRDTLNYLQQRISTLTGKPDSVKAIHGGVRRTDRRDITEEFTKNPDCQILLATDAAGEGLNLQAAHLMVNYDLPWNPNRIEQRFGRIHRIGQKEVCRLWNLVAEDTREGEVFIRLLLKIEEQRKAYGGKVFDVLGSALTGRKLRDLLLEAIRYGDQPETRAQMELVIDKSVGEGIPEMLKEQSLAATHMRDADVAELRRLMDDARARRLQPHYIEGAFKAAFIRLGGRIPRRESGRFEITNVPVRVRQTGPGPVASRYDRVTFEAEHVEREGSPTATLLAPGQPLHDAVADLTIEQLGDALERGAVLVSSTITEPQLLVGVREEIADATNTTVAERFSYAYVDAAGTVTAAGPAPYLDCVAAPLTDAVVKARELPWLQSSEQTALQWISVERSAEFLAETKLRREEELIKVREHVAIRLNQEHERLIAASMKAGEDERLGKKPKQTAASLLQKAGELDVRRERRLAQLDRQLQMQPVPPRIATAALLLPVDFAGGWNAASPPAHAVDTKTVERRAVDLVLATEKALGRHPVEQAFNNPGFDILSGHDGEDPIRIEVKGRIVGAGDFFITHNEVVLGLNAAPRYRLALVSVSPDGPEHDLVRYIENPFSGFDAGDFQASGHTGNWTKTWANGRQPF